MVAPALAVPAVVGLVLLASLGSFRLGQEHTAMALREVLKEAKKKVREKVKNGEFDSEVFVMFSDICDDIEETVKRKDMETIEILRERIDKLFKDYGIDPLSILDLGKLLLIK